MALYHTQESFIGVIEGGRLRGLDSLTSLAGKYGVKIIPQGDQPEQKFVKKDRFRRGWGTTLPFLRRYPSALDDFPAFVGEIPWCLSSETTSERVTVREGMLRCVKWSSPKHWGVLVDEMSVCETKGVFILGILQKQLFKFLVIKGINGNEFPQKTLNEFLRNTTNSRPIEI